jgi:hypothetical protein
MKEQFNCNSKSILHYNKYNLQFRCSLIYVLFMAQYILMVSYMNCWSLLSLTFVVYCYL